MASAPTLQDVRERPEPAWLWDADRGRIVWANKAGIAWFGGEILFDLIDRPFDLGEPGVAQIREIAPALTGSDGIEANLQFHSSGHEEAIDCLCHAHRLPDGRPGVLVVGKPAPVQAGVDGPFAAAFELLPQAALLLDQSGVALASNQSARLLFGKDQLANLVALGGQDGATSQMLQRLAKTATVSQIISVDSLIGPRDVRLTLRRLAQGGDSFILALIDDVTERRRMERQAIETSSAGGSASGPRLLPAEAEAFQQLGRVLVQAVAETPKKTSPLVPEQIASPTSGHRRPADIPFSILSMLDRVPDALILARDGEVLHGNGKALALFGYKTAYELLNDDTVWNFFGQPLQSLPLTSLSLKNGQTASFMGSVTYVPWNGGLVRQFTLQGHELGQKTPAASPAPQPARPAATAPPAEMAKAAEAANEAAPMAVEAPTAVPNAPQATVTDSEWRAIIDTATDGIITLDRMGKIQTFSAGAEAIFGYRNAEVADQFFSSLLAPDSRKVVRDYLAALQGPGLASVFNDGREVTAIVKQGGTVPLFLTIGALQSPRSKAAFCAVVRDITQWKRSESELREAKEQAEEASRQKSEFLARISHELRTPLNAIMGFSEVIRLERFGPLSNDRYRSYVNDIHASGSLLLSLINDLLDLSKVEAGQMDLNFTSVNLGDAADSAIRMLQDAATAARVVIRKAIPPEIPNVVADLRSMRQILLNLLSNAIKFTDPGGQVIISAVVTKAGELKLRIKDTGIGMNAEQTASALEPFKRIQTDGREAPGTGLGLPLTKALTEANRASFSIASEPRKGTLVEITFPTTRVLAD